MFFTFYQALARFIAAFFKTREPHEPDNQMANRIFHLFSSLPRELQSLIWQHALPSYGDIPVTNDHGIHDSFVTVNLDDGTENFEVTRYRPMTLSLGE